MTIGIYETIELGIEGKLATITLRRPAQLNALNQPLLEELLDAIQRVKSFDAIGALMLTGEGRGFCAGADLGEANKSFEPEKRQAQGKATRESMEKYFNPIVSQLLHLPKPTIAAVNGPAAGGGVGLALACDIVFAAESAFFSQVFIQQLGIVPDVGSTWLLPRSIGNARARAAMLLGEKIPAKQAEEWGMIYRAVADDQLIKTANEAAVKLARGATFGISELKKTLLASEGNDFDQQLQLEAETQEQCCGSSDFVEGVNAFLNKRTPEFTGDKNAAASDYDNSK